MYAGFGGGERCIQDHIKYLTSIGVFCNLILLESGKFTDIASKAGATVSEIPFRWQGSKFRSLSNIIKHFFKYRSYLKEHRPDIHIAYTLNDLILVGLAARTLRIPVVYRAQADVFGNHDNHTKTWLGRLLLPVLKIISPYIICTTGYERDNLIQLGISASRVVHIPLGVDLSDFHPRPGISRQLRKSLGCSGLPIVAMFGRLARWKGQQTFISALIELNKMGIHVCAWIVGDASFGDGERYVDELKTQAKKLGNEEQIKFLGFRSDVNHLMSACDVVCHASESEPFGMVIVEAMALARPVIATDVSGPRESVIDGKTGYLFPPGDAVCMAQRLHELISDQSLSTKMGQAGQKRVKEYFDIRKNLHDLHEACVRLTS